MFWKIFAAAIGWAIAASMLEYYLHWRSRRTDVQFVPDGRGGFEDSILRWERRGRVLLWASIVLILLLGFQSLSGGWPFGPDGFL